MIDIVTDREALDAINRAGTRQDLVIRRHAWDRMDERGASIQDVFNAAMTATHARYQTDRSTWKATGGTDLDGDDLTLAVAIEADVIVVTIF